MDSGARSKALRNRLEDIQFQCYQECFPRFVPGVPTEIFPHLFLGAAEHAMDVPQLSGNNITAVVNMAERDVATGAGFYPADVAYLGFPADDESWYAIMQHFREVHEFIERMRDAGRRVLVHCSKGVSRSATMVLAHAMLHRGWTLEQSVRHVAALRPIVQPNVGFVRQLIHFDFSRQDVAK
eukprot:TRINITY_DN23624_c0_g1_i1.p2 TRINITY_DN23624_c0_g1~~TRINITY_DN23624_c0_g1_i1.p2  ORF type:complete len:182 (-),score=53.97 TRINITY_DN23624_c0_g1_i1:8-553(-)